MIFKKAAALISAATLVTIGIAFALPANAEDAKPMTWVTLGTQGGPVVKPDMSQPANLLIFGEHRWLIDCGDGCTEKLGQAGFQPPAVDTVFLSHLHMDHIGGLQGFIGLRWMLNARTPLTIYGPPGTDELVKGILLSMVPSERVGFGIPGAVGKPADDSIKVVILNSGEQLEHQGVQVETVQNSHFDAPEGAPQVTSTMSLSFKFSLDGYTIGMTGDTGVSDAVTKLLTGSDMIISEVIDLKNVVAEITSEHSPVPKKFQPGLVAHITAHHLTTDEAGELAESAGAKTLVYTHLSVTEPVDDVAERLIAETKTKFSGEVMVAHDLDKF